MKRKRYSIIGIIFIAFMMQSCAITTIITMDEVPGLQGGSPLSKIEPVTFVINDFKDERSSIKEIFGDERIVGTANARRLKTDRQVTDIVKQAIISELKRNGHKVSTTVEDTSKANVIINGSVRQYWVEIRPVGMFGSYEVLAFVKADITVRYSDSGGIHSKLYNGFSDLKHPSSFSVEKWRTVLNEALLNMVKDFTMDPDLLDGLNKVAKGSGPKINQKD